MNYINIFKKGCFDRSKNKKNYKTHLLKREGHTSLPRIIFLSFSQKKYEVILLNLKLFFI